MRPVVLVFLALNAFVFGMWLARGPDAFMTEHFLISYDGLVAGRWWTLLTSEFSHFQLLHFFLNMYVLATFGPIVEAATGSVRFLWFYLAAAVLASLSHALVSAFLMGQPGIPALGASGAISGVIILFSLIMPRARILLFGIVPMPAFVGALAFVGLDLVGLFAQTQGSGLPIGHGAHLGGAATGALFYLVASETLGRRRSRIDVGDATSWQRLMSRDPGGEA